MPTKAELERQNTHQAHRIEELEKELQEAIQIGVEGNRVIKIVINHIDLLNEVINLAADSQAIHRRLFEIYEEISKQEKELFDSGNARNTEFGI